MSSAEPWVLFLKCFPFDFCANDIIVSREEQWILMADRKFFFREMTSKFEQPREKEEEKNSKITTTSRLASSCHDFGEKIVYF